MDIMDDQVRDFRENGFLGIDPFIPSAELEPLRSRLDLLASGQELYPPKAFHTLDPNLYRGPNGQPVPEGIQRPAQYDEAFERIAGHPALKAIMRGLIGEDAERFTDQVIIKNPEAGVTTHFHQDGFYWRNSGQRTVNCWIALDEADEENGVLRFIPGSHLEGLIEHERYFDEPTLHSGATGAAMQRLRIPLDQADFSRERVVPLAAGGCVVFAKLCWHRSDPNRSGRKRRAYAVAYHGTDASRDESEKLPSQSRS